MLNLYLGGAPYYDIDAATYGTEDIRFYRRYADLLNQRRREKGGPLRILELACGTGRVSLPLARAGYEVDGLDLSEAMLSIFLEKLQEEPEEVRERVSLFHGDMAEFAIPKAPYDLIIIPFRGFQALVETTEAMGALNCAKRHLAQEGLFILNVFAVAPFNRWIDDYQERIDWRKRDPRTGAQIVRARIAGESDTRQQIINPTTIYYVTHEDGRSERIEDPFSLRYYFQHQIETLLVASGFELLEEFGDYRGAPIGEGAEQIFVCRSIRKPKLLG